MLAPARIRPLMTLVPARERERDNVKTRINIHGCWGSTPYCVVEVVMCYINSADLTIICHHNHKLVYSIWDSKLGHTTATPDKISFKRWLPWSTYSRSATCTSTASKSRTCLNFKNAGRTDVWQRVMLVTWGARESRRLENTGNPWNSTWSTEFM